MKENMLLLLACLVFLAVHGASFGDEMAVKANHKVSIPKINNTNLLLAVTATVDKMQDAIREIDVFAKTHKKRKKFHGWWMITEKTDGVTNMLRTVIFKTKNGLLPDHATKRLFRDKNSHSGFINEMDGGYMMYFFPDGKVKSFKMRGAIHKTLHFRPSGTIKEFFVTKVGEHKTVAELICAENGTVKHEKYLADTKNIP